MSEQNFYDKQGRPIAYTYDQHIYLFSGEPVAYFYDDSIYSFSGKHLGRYDQGWIRDNNGNCVFFDESATGGPIKPIKGIKPIKSIKGIRPIKSIKEIKPIRPIRSLSWSQLSSVAFFN